METMEILSPLSFSLKQTNQQFGYLTVTIPSEYVERLYHEASDQQQQKSHVLGFSRGQAPVSYIEQNFQPHLLEHIKEFFFKYFVIDSLYKKLQDERVFFAGEPRLTNILIAPHQNASFSFSLTLAKPIPLQGWKRLPFKAPKRKNYKDLDRQVENFLKEEQEAAKKVKLNVVDLGDWVNFHVSVLDKSKKPLFGNFKERLWLKVGVEEADGPFQSLFVGKKVGDSFVTDHPGLQEHFSTHLDTNYLFLIEIVDYLSHAYFCVEHFKRHFKLKNAKELHQKCIEVFSYRNDISQRRATSEEALKTLLSKHIITVPPHLVLRQEKAILEMVCAQPDYHVYKMQPDFREKITLLAEKQLRESTVIQQLAFLEKITVNNMDVKGYLNLLCRQRTSEFIYFEPPTTKFSGREAPVSASLLAQCCLKEKTLNHAILHLTKPKATP